MLDQPDYTFTDDLPQIFEFIESTREQGGRILVHCYQGKSRSCAVCCAYLMKYRGHSLESALKLVREVRPIASPNSGFMASLEALDAEYANARIANLPEI